IQVKNDGPNDATGVEVLDLVSSIGYSSINGTPSVGTYNDITGLWQVGSLPVGQIETLTITATAENTTNDNYNNIAEVIAVDQQDVDSTPNNNNPAEDDQDSVNPTVVPISDLELTKTVDISNPEVNSEVTFSITVTNLGPNSAPGVQITDVLP